MTTSTNAPKQLNWFQKEALKVLGILEADWHTLAPIIQNGFVSAVTSVIPIVEPIVLSLVADPSKSGLAKAEAAINSAKPALEAAGINAGTNVVNSAITVLVSQLPKATASAASASSAGTGTGTPA